MDKAALILFSMVASAAVIIIWSLSFRYKRQELLHRERMAALEKGVPVPDQPSETPRAPWSPRIYLLRGLVWLFSGIGLAVFLFGLSVSIGSRPQTYESRLWRAAQLRHENVPDEQIKEFLNSKEPVRSDFPAGISLIGLIPIGVGLAYIIYYRGEERRPA